MLKYVNYQKYDKKSKTTEINIHEKNMDSVKQRNIKQTEFKGNIIGKHDFMKTELAPLGIDMKSK